MVLEEETIVEDELQRELTLIEEGSGHSIELKKDRIIEINQHIKTLLEERDFIEKEILDLEDDLEVED